MQEAKSCAIFHFLFYFFWKPITKSWHAPGICSEKSEKRPPQCKKQRNEQKRAGSWVAGCTWIYQLVSTGRHGGNLPISPPALKPGQEKIASRTALDLKQFQTSFTVFRQTPRGFPRAVPRGEEQTSPWSFPGQEPTTESFRLLLQGIKQVKSYPGLITTPQPTDNSTEVSKIINNNNYN